MPKEIYIRRADATKNKIVIPKKFVKKHGYVFSVEVYDDKITIKPTEEK